MSEEQENTESTASLTDDGKEALSALRGIWKAQNQTSADLDEACGNTTACRSMEAVGFHGLEDESDKPTQSVGNNLRAAWKNKLEREGKLSTGTSVRDLVLGSSDPKE
ncbi:MAG: hypothetical protein ACRDTX_09105 [Pseudonocardiaceae bacterium]